MRFKGNSPGYYLEDSTRQNKHFEFKVMLYKLVVIMANISSYHHIINDSTKCLLLKICVQNASFTPQIASFTSKSVKNIGTLPSDFVEFTL